jgi:hypothetical protein
VPPAAPEHGKAYRLEADGTDESLDAIAARFAAEPPQHGAIPVTLTIDADRWCEDGDFAGGGDYVVRFLEAEAGRSGLFRRSRSTFSMFGKPKRWRYEVHAPRGQWHLWLEMLLTGLLRRPPS